MKVAMVRHDELLEKAIAANQGDVFARMGDGMAAAFATARDAISAAATIQRALLDEPWRTVEPLRARIGLHTDEAVVVDDGGYASLPINRCSRLMTAAHGGQVVISGATEVLVRAQLPEAMTLIDLGEHRLRDLGRPLRVFQLISCGCRRGVSTAAKSGRVSGESTSPGQLVHRAQIRSGAGHFRTGANRAQ